MRVIGRISNWQVAHGNTSWPAVEELENIETPLGMSPAVRAKPANLDSTNDKEQRHSEATTSGLSALITASTAFTID
jgi:hypothetical protein